MHCLNGNMSKGSQACNLQVVKRALHAFLEGDIVVRIVVRVSVVVILAASLCPLTNCWRLRALLKRKHVKRFSSRQPSSGEAGLACLL